jgi:serine/threonine protein kinase
VLSPPKRDGPDAAPAPNRARFEPVPGIVVADKYRVERVLGEGGMGVVVAATHLALDQRVAIKFLVPEAMRHKEAVERFQREARVAAKVNSEHVARVHDVGTLEGGEPFIVMEYLEGSDLRQLIGAAEPLSISDACEIALQACEALAQVHAAGIVHRDLKPSNLFVTRRADGSPCVKLLDFGISKFNFQGEPGTDPALTATATVMGSPSYMSPEQLRSSKEVDASTDVWSLGAVLYEAVTGRPAFRGETVLQVCAMIASDDPALPSSLRPALSPQLDRAIIDCLQKKPEKRARLVDLARRLVDFAPERARVSLERIEAVLGEPPSRPRSPIPPPPGISNEDDHREDLPILPLATSEEERSLSSPTWSGRKGGRGGLSFLVLLALGLLGIGLYTGSIDVRALRGQVEGATSAVASAVNSALPSAFPLPKAAPIASATPAASATPTASATPNPTATTTPTPTGIPIPSSAPAELPMLPSAGASNAPETTDELPQSEEPPIQPIPSPAPAPVAHPVASAHSAPAPAKHHPTKPKHSVKVHRHH